MNSHWERAFAMDVGRLCFENKLTELLRNSPGQVKFHMQCVVYALHSDNAELRYSPHPDLYLPYITPKDMEEFINILEITNSFVDNLSNAAITKNLKDVELSEEYKKIAPCINETAFKKLLYFSIFSSRLQLAEHQFKNFTLFITFGSPSHEYKFHERVGVDYKIMFYVTGCENVYYICRHGKVPQSMNEMRLSIEQQGRCIPLTNPKTLVFGRSRAVICLAVRASAVLPTVADHSSGEWFVRGCDSSIKGILWPTGPGMVEVCSEMIQRAIQINIGFMNTSLAKSGQESSVVV